ncbi:MAG: ATP-binding protein [Rickettsiales bacterium]|nr:ATP-binding protein [Rickettsiales bacterium]
MFELLDNNSKSSIFYNQVLNKILNGIVIIDNKGNIANYNNFAERIFGFSRDDVLGNQASMLFTKESANLLETYLNLYLNFGNSEEEGDIGFESELNGVTKDGKNIKVKVGINKIDIEGVRKLVCIIDDVTENRKEQENLLKAKQEAEAANRAKSDFLANMSHELRTPMNGIMGLTELILDTELTNEQKEFVKLIYSSSDNLLNILNDILDLSKIEAGMMEVEEVPFDITKALSDLCKLYTPVAKDKGLCELKVQYFSDIPQAVMGDYSKFSQIVRNLLSNAIKFTEKGGVEIIAEANENKIKISVFDTGIGIPAERIEKIFDKFTQADNSTTRKYGGTGLGLAIVKEYVNMLGGQIGVNSQVNYGSEFWFEIPIKIVSETPINSKKIGTNNFSNFDRKSKILVVDDHPVNRLFAKKLLSKMGFTDIDMAEDGMQAIEKVNENEYFIVFMDCQMPNLDGYQSTKLIREMEKSKNSHLNIIAMTANAMNGDREKCLKAGMDEYISKPIKSNKLLDVLSKFVDIDLGVTSVQSPNHANNNDPVDLNHLSLFTDGDKKEERELTSLFFEQAKLSITSLAEALAYDNLDEWRDAAHKLKGASANFGANNLSNIALDAEKFFSESPEKKREFYSLIISEIEKVSKFMNYNIDLDYAKISA